MGNNCRQSLAFFGHLDLQLPLVQSITTKPFSTFSSYAYMYVTHCSRCWASEKEKKKNKPTRYITRVISQPKQPQVVWYAIVPRSLSSAYSFYMKQNQGVRIKMKNHLFRITSLPPLWLRMHPYVLVLQQSISVQVLVVLHLHSPLIHHRDTHP